MLGRAETSDTNHFVENALGDLAFSQLRESEIPAIARKQSDDVGIEIEARAFSSYVVGDDEVGIFGGEFLARIFRDVVRFSGESNDQPIGFRSGSFGQNIRRWLEMNRQRFFGS